MLIKDAYLRQLDHNFVCKMTKPMAPAISVAAVALVLVAVGLTFAEGALWSVFRV